ncbi:MAG: phospho-N-acetylmuramoyl-pentapeptide-transferase [Myxococcota bacterium]
MLFHLFFELREYFGPLNVFRYVSFRIVAAMLTALMISFVLYPWFIRRLQLQQIGQVVREEGPSTHFSKRGTPTMGGSLILFALVIPTLLWTDLTNPYVWIALMITLSYGVVGFVDDYLKISKKSSGGLSGRYKLLSQFGIAFAVLAGLLLYEPIGYNTELFLPFVSTAKFSLELPWWVYMLFASVVIVGTSNAVNLTDGLDGLAIGPVIVAAGTFLIMAYAVSTELAYYEVVDGVQVLHKFDIAAYLNIPKVEGVEELAIFCAAIMGAGVGFLWYNTFPAQIFMGDVGSLSLGGALGTMAVVTKNELLSMIIFGIFLVEAISVITQTTSYKLTGKRVFKMAPIHHHFELKGWKEPQIVVRFWIIAIMLALVALASLKLR